MAKEKCICGHKLHFRKLTNEKGCGKCDPLRINVELLKKIQNNEYSQTKIKTTAIAWAFLVLKNGDNAQIAKQIEKILTENGIYKNKNGKINIKDITLEINKIRWDVRNRSNSWYGCFELGQDGYATLRRQLK